MRLVIRVPRLITFRDWRFRIVLASASYRARTFKFASHRLLPQSISLLANPDRVFAKLGAEDGLYVKQGLERGDIDIIMYTPEPPSHALAGHAKRPINLVSVGTAQDHVTRFAGSELNP